MIDSLKAVVDPSVSPTPNPEPPPAADDGPWDEIGRWLVGVPLRVVSIIAVSIVLIVLMNWLVDRLVKRFTAKADEQEEAAREQEGTTTSPLAALRSSARRAQRIAAIGSLLKSIFAAIITLTATLTILPLFGVDIAPLLVSASVLGVALGFGAQNLIKDYLSGVYIVLEDQYGVGDVIEVSGIVGTVEDVTLRVTQLRDLSGVVWYVRNGEILQVANRSKGWTLATADIPIDPDADLDAVRAAVDSTGAAMIADPATAADLVEAPYYAGVESVSSTATVIRVAAKAAPDKQVAVSRELREQMRAGLHAAGIAMATTPAFGAGPTPPTR